jgi:hypothetical protein
MATRYFGRPILNSTRVRQGRLGRDVFWVLLFSTALAFLGLFGAWTWRAGDLASVEHNNGKQVEDAQAFNANAPTAPQDARPAR